MKYCMSVVFSTINVQKKYILPIDKEGESLQLAPTFPIPFLSYLSCSKNVLVSYVFCV